MWGLPPNHVHKIYRKLPLQTLPWTTVRVTMLKNLSSKQVFDCSTYMRSTVSCMAILIVGSSNHETSGQMAALWGWKHPTHRTQTDQAGKTTTQSARCYVFCDCTHIRRECIDGVGGASLGTKTMRKLNLCGDGSEPTPHAQGNPLVLNTVGESDE